MVVLPILWHSSYMTRLERQGNCNFINSFPCNYRERMGEGGSRGEAEDRQSNLKVTLLIPRPFRGICHTELETSNATTYSDGFNSLLDVGRLALPLVFKSFTFDLQLTQWLKEACQGGVKVLLPGNSFIHQFLTLPGSCMQSIVSLPQGGRITWKDKR